MDAVSHMENDLINNEQCGIGHAGREGRNTTAHIPHGTTPPGNTEHGKPAIQGGTAHHRTTEHGGAGSDSKKHFNFLFLKNLFKGREKQQWF